MNIKVVHYNEDYVPNPNPRSETTVEEFWEVRLAILETTQRFGECGPESGSMDATYYLVEDLYNDELYQNMEVYNPVGWSAEWLAALSECLHKHKGWAINVGYIDGGHLLIFADRIVVQGPTFANCTDVDGVAAAAKGALERYLERKNAPLRRQLDYIQKQLAEAMKEADAKSFVHMATFDRFELKAGNAIWILHSKRFRELRLDAECESCRESAVTADGTIHPPYCPDFWPNTEVSPPYWLEIYLTMDTAKNEFPLVDDEDSQVGTIRIGKVISDDELK